MIHSKQRRSFPQPASRGRPFAPIGSIFGSLPSTSHHHLLLPRRNHFVLLFMDSHYSEKVMMAIGYVDLGFKRCDHAGAEASVVLVLVLLLQSLCSVKVRVRRQMSVSKSSQPMTPSSSGSLRFLQQLETLAAVLFF